MHDADGVADCQSGFTDARQVIAKLLRYKSDFVNYWALQVVLVLAKCPLHPRNTQQEFINKQSLFTTDMLSRMVHLMATGLVVEMEEAPAAEEAPEAEAAADEAAVEPVEETKRKESVVGDEAARTARTASTAGAPELVQQQQPSAQQQDLSPQQAPRPQSQRPPARQQAAGAPAARPTSQRAPPAQQSQPGQQSGPAQRPVSQRAPAQPVGQVPPPPQQQQQQQQQQGSPQPGAPQPGAPQPGAQEPIPEGPEGAEGAEQVEGAAEGETTDPNNTPPPESPTAVLSRKLATPGFGMSDLPSDLADVGAIIEGVEGIESKFEDYEVDDEIGDQEGKSKVR
jgi:hypothetical protein